MGGGEGGEECGVWRTGPSSAVVKEDSGGAVGASGLRIVEVDLRRWCFLRMLGGSGSRGVGWRIR